VRRHASSDALSSYLDEQVTAQEARWIEEHLGACAECRRRLQGLRRVVRALGDLEPVAPPPGLGLELQRHLARATPPFAERDPAGPRAARSVLQPAVLVSLGIVLALAVILLLFLQALQGGGADAAGGPSEPDAPIARVVIGELTFRRSTSGWVEASVSDAESATARVVSRRDLGSPAEEDVLRALDELEGEVTLRAGGEVVRVRD
jgi:anti-sigma factor RsiW